MKKIPIIIGGVVIAIIIGGIIIWVRTGRQRPPEKPEIVEMNGKIANIWEQTILMVLFQIECEDGKIRDLTKATSLGYVLGQNVIVEVDLKTDSIISMRPTEE